MPKINRAFKERIGFIQRRTTPAVSVGFNASKHQDDSLPFLKREGRPDASIIEGEWNRGDERKAQLRRMKVCPLFRPLGVMRRASVIEGRVAS